MDKRLVWLAVGSFVMSTVGFVFSSLLPSIAADAHITIPHAGHLITAFSLAYAIGAPTLSALAGATDRRRLLVAAMLTFVAGNAVAALSTSFATLLLAQIIMGAAAGLFAATAQATAVALAGPEHRALAISIVVGGTTFAVAIGAPLGSLVAAFWGWRGTFLSIACLAIVCAVVLWFRLPHGLKGTRLTMRERLQSVGKPGVLPSLLVTLLYLTGAFALISFLAPLAMEGAGLPALAMPAMLLAFGIGAVVGNLSSGYLADRIGATRVVVLSLLLASTVCLVISVSLKLLPPDIAGPLLIGLMVPWGIIGWAFPAGAGQPHRRLRAGSRAPDAVAQCVGHLSRHRARHLHRWPRAGNRRGLRSWSGGRRPAADRARRTGDEPHGRCGRRSRRCRPTP